MLSAGQLKLRALRGHSQLTHAEWVWVCDPQNSRALGEESVPSPLNLMAQQPQTPDEVRRILLGCSPRPAPLPGEDIGGDAGMMEFYQEKGHAATNQMPVPAALLWHMTRINLLIRTVMTWGPERTNDNLQLCSLVRRELSACTDIGISPGLSFCYTLLRISTPHLNVRLVSLLAGDHPRSPDNPSDSVAVDLLRTTRRLLKSRELPEPDSRAQHTLNAIQATISGSDS